MANPHIIEFIIYHESSGRKQVWRWRAIRGNHIVSDAGETFKSRANAYRAMQNFVGGIREAKFILPDKKSNTRNA